MTASYDKYTVTQYSMSSLLGYIDAGDIAIPEIQRPFVWKGKNVRDLIDSLYNGYPTGYLIIWQNPNVRLKNGQESVGKKVLIDGQQRITALMTAIAGKPVLNEDYEERTIKIAFNPIAEEEDGRFAVQTPVHLKTKHWIPDISELFKTQFSVRKFINQYLEENPKADEDLVDQAITQLLSIKSCQLGAIVLIPQLDINEVTEIFVRINSQGKRLNESDFAMSKIAADERYGGNLLRKAIDYFCHLAVEPSFYNKLALSDHDFMKSEFEPKLRWLRNDKEDIYDPDYSDMLRVSFMHTFNRAKLGDLVSLLSGRDFADRKFKEEIAATSFEKLHVGVLDFMNEYNFEQFILAIKSAGFISLKLLNSRMTLDFAYTLFLLLQNKNEVSKIEIKKYIQKWFVLSTLTSRYVNSAESQMDRDLRSIASKGFISFFKENESSMLSDTFWTVRLVQNMETSSVNSPYFNTFIAAQIFSGDRSLLSNSSKVVDLVSVAGDVHHIFPKDYLRKNGFNERSLYNQVANFTYLDTGVNISIGNKSPSIYFSEALAQCGTSTIVSGTITDPNDFWDNLSVNCIPNEIINMTVTDYPDFLMERRRQMAQKIKNYYFAL
ncbi:DUF262 domain-containing protein [Sporolactobacillus sp. STSJ-5]|uniref:GmrSD restriction endonuclease domain-containing protein n=1 Tax=Sporolactobacillus sp. STSJ-5 TaxID=2965076 RepID=UPI00210804E9|nr:DUF262 domain-containing protein [Sporolactobacillus sp. STSJ-5]MCQ2010947.1 DUF262 domain-containing protein [Sporolactobacillus sp. STSJ-5]